MYLNKRRRKRSRAEKVGFQWQLVHVVYLLYKNLQVYKNWFAHFFPTSSKPAARISKGISKIYMASNRSTIQHELWKWSAASWREADSLSALTECSLSGGAAQKLMTGGFTWPQVSLFHLPSHLKWQWRPPCAWWPSAKSPSLQRGPLSADTVRRPQILLHSGS